MTTKCQICGCELKGRQTKYCSKCKSEGCKITMQQYQSDNKEQIAKNKKRYYTDNKEKLAENAKQYYIDNKEKLTDYQKRYQSDNKEKRAENTKQWLINNPDYNKQHYEDTRDPNTTRQGSKEYRIKVSARHQGISIDDWDGFATNSPYCEKFNESCRESNRDKYDRECFICGKPESKNFTKSGKLRKLSVHHIDMNKQQGCNDNEWKLVPVCLNHHGMLHTELWEARIKYLLRNF